MISLESMERKNKIDAFVAKLREDKAQKFQRSSNAPIQERFSSNNENSVLHDEYDSKMLSSQDEISNLDISFSPSLHSLEYSQSNFSRSPPPAYDEIDDVLDVLSPPSKSFNDKTMKNYNVKQTHQDSDCKESDKSSYYQDTKNCWEASSVSSNDSSNVSSRSENKRISHGNNYRMIPPTKTEAQGKNNSRYSNSDEINRNGNQRRDEKDSLSSIHNKISTFEPRIPDKLAEIQSRSQERKARLKELQDISKEKILKKAQEDKDRQSQKEERERLELLRIQQEKKLELRKLKEISENQRKQSLTKVERSSESQIDMEKAWNFRRKGLLLRCGFSPWMKLMEISRQQNMRALQFQEDRKVMKSFLQWYAYIDECKRERFRKDYRLSALAVSHFKRKTMMKVWKAWALYRKLLRAKAKAITGHFSRFVRSKVFFRLWRLMYQRRLRERDLRIKAMVPRGNLCIKRHFWSKWNEFLEESRIEKEVRSRSAHTWVKLQRWMKDTDDIC